MSFELELYASVRDWAEAERAAAATASDRHVSVVPGRRKRWGRTLEPTIHFDWRQGQHVLSDQADWDHDAFLLDEERRHDLAATVLVLAGMLEPGWGIRAYWRGDPLESESATTADRLADLIRRSQLNRYTLYRLSVPA